VSEILTDPSNLARGLDRMIESERRPSSAEDEASWLGRISEIDAKQERLLDLRLDGDITPERFRARSARLGEARGAAEDQLAAARSRLSRLKDIERGKDAVVSHYASLVPQGLADLPSEERNRVYKTMRLRVFAHRDGTLIADWGCNDAPLPRWSSIVTTPAPRFRAVLTGNGSGEIEVVEAQRGADSGH
jgi:hypothetical protein